MRNSIHNFKKEKPTARMDAIVNIIRISVEMKRINDAFVAVELFFMIKIVIMTRLLTIVLFKMMKL